MAFRRFVIMVLMAGFAALASWLLAGRSVMLLEAWTKDDLSIALRDAGLVWAEVDANGLQVNLSGTASEESARFRALEVAGQIVGTSRIQDSIEIAKPGQELVPEFQIEILRNGADVSLIGLMPNRDDRVRVLKALGPLHEEGTFSDLMEALDYPAPPHWDATLDFALDILPMLARSTITISPGALDVEASLVDLSTVDVVRKEIEAITPETVNLDLVLSAPKAVLAPFRFEARADAAGILDVTLCHLSGTSEQRGLDGFFKEGDASVACQQGLGSPSANWIKAVTAGLDALRRMKGGQLEIADTDIRLFGADGLTEPGFNEIAASLKTQLPPVFSLNATPADPAFAVNPAARPDAPRFRAAVDPRTGLIMTGGLRDALALEATSNYANSLFGGARVDSELSVSQELAPGWTAQVLAALGAAARLNSGVVQVEGDQVNVSGIVTDAADEPAMRTALVQWFDEERIRINLELKPEEKASRTRPEARVCERQLANIMADNNIIFAPNSADISNESEILLDRIAAIITSCSNATFEIGGHTDSQGREQMNLGLSQSRADAVLDALLQRDVMLELMIAKGYGESQPIAENNSEAGRAKNRRIAFKLVDIFGYGKEAVDEPAQTPASTPAPEPEPAPVTTSTPTPTPAPTPTPTPTPTPAPAPTQPADQPANQTGTSTDG